MLKDKAPQFVEISPKATVPVLVVGPTVLEESLEIMVWALGKNDPEGWLDMPDSGHSLIADNDGAFKVALDRTKYADRYDCDPEQERRKAGEFLQRLAQVSPGSSWLFGDKPRLADMALLPFVRQFAHVDRERFNADAPAWVRCWLDRFLQSPSFAQVMTKYPKWVAGDDITVFPS